MPELLLEIGCEEIPARFVSELEPQIIAKADELILRERISSPTIELTFMGTPRRIVLKIKGLKITQETKTLEKWGPTINQAYDMNGNPTKAALGFAKSVGVPLEKLEKKDSGKGARLYYRSERPGLETASVLKTLLPELILSLKFPRSMTWGSGKMRFARPIHWLLALFNGKVINFELDGIKSGNQTYGHRFLAPEAFNVKSAEDYVQSLRKAWVIVDPKERQEMIELGLAQKADELGAQMVSDPDLVREVNYLVEYPVALAGEFSSKFLEVPAEVLIAAMRGHQRYFALKQKDGALRLVASFLFVSNMKTEDDAVVVQGNQKVLSARLTDAEFFYREDMKTLITERAKNLDQMVFQTGLGTYLDKAQRLEKLIEELISRVQPEDKGIRKYALAAVRLCKADLLTQMVGEFPELEGVMAGEYARAQKQPEMVWKAVREHYLPKTAEDIVQHRLPETALGQLLSIADKIDSIAAGFVAGHEPTGSQDPYGIRRMANAVVSIAVSKEIDFDLDALLQTSVRLYADMFKKKPEQLPDRISEFFRTRMKNIMVDEGIEYDIVNAVIAAWDGSILSARKRVQALSELRHEPGFADLFVGFRRVARIIEETGELDTSLFEYPEEKKLWESFLAIKGRIEELLKVKKWKEAMRELGMLKPEIDRFFDKVMVNVEDPKLKLNRHSLLNNIAKEFRAIADFAQLAGGEKSTEGGGNG